jgi:hypothetical protein
MPDDLREAGRRAALRNRRADRVRALHAPDVRPHECWLERWHLFDAPVGERSSYEQAVLM